MARVVAVGRDGRGGCWWGDCGRRGDGGGEFAGREDGFEEAPARLGEGERGRWGGRHCGGYDVVISGKTRWIAGVASRVLACSYPVSCPSRGSLCTVVPVRILVHIRSKSYRVGPY